MSLPNGRPRPVQRTEHERIERRLMQAHRAADSGRSVVANTSRIKRLRARLVALAAPPAPEPCPTAEELYVEAASDACGTQVPA